MPLYQFSILQERDFRELCVRCPQGHYLEGPVAIANDVQQGLRVSGVEITDNGNLSRLREGKGKRLEPLAKALWLLGSHALS